MQDFFLRGGVHHLESLRLRMKLCLHFGDFVLKADFWGLTGNWLVEVWHLWIVDWYSCSWYAYAAHLCLPLHAWLICYWLFCSFLCMCVYPCLVQKEASNSVHDYYSILIAVTYMALLFMSDSCRSAGLNCINSERVNGSFIVLNIFTAAWAAKTIAIRSTKMSQHKENKYRQNKYNVQKLASCCCRPKQPFGTVLVLACGYFIAAANINSLL